MTSQSETSKITLAPSWSLKKSIDLSAKYKEYFEKENQRRKEEAEKLKQERTELWNSVWFDRNYYVPFEKFNQFLTDPNFDIEYYSYDSYKKRDQREREIKDYAYNLLGEYRDNYIENEKVNSNTLYYLNLPFISNTINRHMIGTVLEKLKEQFGNEAKDFDFKEEDYNFGQDEYFPLDSELYDDNYMLYDENEQYYSDEELNH